MPAIDIVCTYVNSADPSRRESLKRSLAGLNPKDFPCNTFHSDRLESYDDLRFMLRSLDRHFHEFKTLYIVCEEALPDWLETNHAQLRHVRHREIFPDPAALPTFNSHAIETNLHRIPGLSEEFLYLNDDFLFTAPCDAAFFFSGGLENHFVAEGILDWKSVDIRETDQFIASTTNAARALAAWRPFPPILMTPAHFPYARSKSRFIEMERLFPETFATSSMQKFRSYSSISVASFMYTYYCWRLGASRLNWVKDQFIKPMDVWIRELFPRIRYRFSKKRAEDLGSKSDFLSGVVLASGGKDLRAEKLPFMCANNRMDAVVAARLRWMYPKPSRFEKQNAG